MSLLLLMRIGIFGGSFDPVHYGHLLLAESCREQVRLDEVWFMPAAVPPHKQDQSRAADKHRVEMLQLAISGHDSFVLSTMELERGGVNYTYQTLEQIHEERAADELFFLLGGDSLVDFPTWRHPERVCERATLVVVRRPDAGKLDFQPLSGVVSADRLQQLQQHVVQMPLIGLSSTDIRARAGAGLSIRYRTPPAVAKYIETQRLYE